MTSQFFTTVDKTDEQSLKLAFKRNCLKYHPDKGGNEVDFKAMLAEFETIRVTEEVKITEDDQEWFTGEGVFWNMDKPYIKFHVREIDLIFSKLRSRATGSW